MEINLPDGLKTGDLVLFNGRGLISDSVKIFTGSQWTHIGMVVKDPDFLIKTPIQEGLYLYNSNGKYEVDIETGKKIFGVQMNDLKQTVEDYDGEVVIRRLEIKGTINMNNMNNRMKEVYSTEFHKPYDWLPEDIIGSLLERKGFKIADFFVDPRRIDHAFCSALIGYCYTEMGLMNPETEWGSLYPGDFMKIDTLFDGSKLSTPILVKTKSTSKNTRCNVM